MEKIEYQAMGLCCSDCGAVTKAAFPRWAMAPVSYGPRLHGMANYLTVHQHLPFDRMREHLRDVYGAEVSAGGRGRMVGRGGGGGEAGAEAIKRQLRGA